ncbi:MAG: M56 family metallopeptidase [Bacteroidota bacterium]|nr:M56 family metallopeptidase [Bacteroidota bacterium]
MVEFLLKVSFVIGITLLFYKLVLQQESFFGTNRFYFICCILLSFAVPYIQLPELVNNQGYISTIFQQKAIRENAALAHELKEPNINSETPNVEDKIEPLAVRPLKESKNATTNASTRGNVFIWAYWPLLLYLFGVIIFILNLLFQVGNIFFKIWKSTDKIYDGEHVIVNTIHKQAPCSFFKYIFIYPNDYDLETYEQIIAHEKIHAKLGHSWDILLAELAVIVLWANPLMWMLKREIEKNIEFQTDALLLENYKGSKDSYQMNLLQIATPDKPLTITTNYNQSLLKQRIMMMNAKKSTLNRYWKYAFVLPLLWGSILLLNEPAISKENVYSPKTTNTSDTVSNAQPVSDPLVVSTPIVISTPEKAQTISKPEINSTYKPGSISENRIQEQEDMSNGFWFSRIKENGYCIEFKGSKNEGKWNNTGCFDKSLFKRVDNEVFEMTSEVGTLKLMGAVEKDVIEGKYEFKKSKNFEQYLVKNNIEINPPSLLFLLHLNQVDKDYVDFVKSKFSAISGNQLLTLKIHNVNRNYWEELAKLGYSDLDPDKYITAKVNNINSVTINDWNNLGFGKLSIDEMITLKVHNINAAYIQELKVAGYKNLNRSQIVTAKVHNINSVTINDWNNLGFGKLSIEEMITLKVHGINTSYIQELKVAGYNNLNANQIVTAKVHGINAEYLSELKNAGVNGFSFDNAVQAKVHGVNSGFINDVKNKGYDLQTLDEYIKIKIHGLN